MKTFKRMIKFIKEYTLFQLLALLLALGEVISFLIMPFIFKSFIDDVLTRQNDELLSKVIFLYFITVLAIVIFGLLKEILYKFIHEKVARDLRMFLYKHLKSIEIYKLQELKIGNIMSYFNSDIPQIASGLTISFIQALQNIIRILAGIIILAKINLKILIIVILLLPIYLINALIFNKPIRNSSKKMQEENSTNLGILQENLSGASEIILFNRIEWDFERLYQAFTQYISATLKNTIWVNTSNNTGFLIYWFITIMVYFIGGKSVLEGALSIGTLLFYAQYIDNIFMPSRQLIYTNSDIQRSIAIGERYFNLIDSTSSDKSGEDINRIEITSFTNKIQFKNVSFQLNNEMILENINFEIYKGEIIAIVGPSGSGKSTLIKLLLNLYKPMQGEISIDSMNIDVINRTSFYNIIGIVQQEPFLFSENIIENVRFGRLNATNNDIIDACKLSNAHDFIVQRENGYLGIVNEKGTNLSGGQKQRIAIARALVKNSEIIVFDEPTSSLDVENQEIILETIENLKKQHKTVILVTHNFDQTKIADKIFLVNNGRMEILTKQDIFAKPNNISKNHFN